MEYSYPGPRYIAASLAKGRKRRAIVEKLADRAQVTSYLTAIWRGEKELRATGVTYEVDILIKILCALQQ